MKLAKVPRWILPVVFSVLVGTVGAAFVLSAPQSANSASDVGHEAADRALYAAVAAGDRARAQAALDAGANINRAHAPWGDSALMIACEKSPALVAWLIAQGGEVNQRNQRGQTPLMAAAYAGHAEAVETLLAHGADSAFADRWGDTALTRAVFRGDPRVVATLVRHGADPERANRRGETPRALAAHLLQLVEAMDDSHAHHHPPDDNDHVVTDKLSALRDRRAIVSALK